MLGSNTVTSFISFFRSRLSKPALYFIFLALALGLLETLVYFNFSLFRSLSDRTLLMSALFRHRSQTELLFVGSSRFNDGIAVKTFLHEFRQDQSPAWKGFNASVTGANLARLDTS
jgi:hypothetical protein